MITIERKGVYGRTEVIKIEETSDDVFITTDASDGEYTSPSISLKEIQNLLEKYKGKVVVIRDEDLRSFDEIPLINPQSVEDFNNEMDKIVVKNQYVYSFRIPNEINKEEFTKMENIFNSSNKYTVYHDDSCAYLRCVVRGDFGI